MHGARLVALLTLGIVVSALVASGPQAASTTVVINEVDYDQASTDTAEFLELKNVSATAINLDSYAVELVNGTGGGAVVYPRRSTCPTSRCRPVTTTSFAPTRRTRPTATSTSHRIRT